MLRKGDKVTAILYGGTMAERRVVADKGDVVVICSEGEYQDAEREGREPQGVGFPFHDIQIGEIPKKPVVTERGINERLRSEAGD
jgi:hypothetical protein